jgi:hypothetical protein
VVSVSCWVRDAELREFVRQRCGVETLTDRHRLVDFRTNGEGDVFLTFDRRAAARPKGRRRG